MNDYYNKIELVIKRHEISKHARIIEENNDTLKTNWEIGRLIVEAQGGEKRAKYGNELIREWSREFTELYGKNYSERNMRYFRQFYNTFPIWQSVVAKLRWRHYLQLIPIKDENKRNYYINKCIENNLSSRELIKEIKSNSYERLLDKPDKIEIIQPKNILNIRNDIMNPIILELKEDEKIFSEHDLEMKILSNFQAFSRQLGNGYALIGNQIRIVDDEETHIIDLLLFNIDFNKYIVIELKTRELRSQDKGQIKHYMNLVDKYIKKSFHGKTMGIIISKEQSGMMATFVKEEDIIPITYLLK